MKAHQVVLAACGAACIAFVACRAASQAGSAATGGLIGAAVGGPAGAAGGAAVGALVSDKIADALGADRQYTADEYRALLTDAHKTIAELQGRKPVEVPVPVPFVPSLVKWAIVLAVLWLVFRFRAGIIAFLGSLLTGGFMAATKTAIGLAIGGKAADAAKVATAMHVDARRKRKVGPLKNVVVKEGEHP